MDITDLKITPNKVEHGESVTLAEFIATFEGSLVVHGTIREGKQGIYCTFRGISFASPEARKETCNRVLATYVINHCCDDYATA